MRAKIFLSNFFATFGGYLFEFLSFTMGMLPLSIRLPIVRFFGFLVGRFATNMQRALRFNLTRLLDVPEKDVRSLMDIIFGNFALTLHDFFFPDGLTLHVPERAKLEAVREKHGGIVVLTFHMGQWELGARRMQEWGWPVTAVYQPYRNKKFKEVIESRRAPGVNFIPVGGNAARGVRTALKRGDVVAMLGDHPFGEEGIPVDLLGHRVIWPKGPVVLAAREKAPIVIAVIIRKALREYVAHIADPIFPEGKSKAEVDRLVQEVANKFGKLLSENSRQWYRFKELEFVK